MCGTGALQDRRGHSVSHLHGFAELTSYWLNTLKCVVQEELISLFISSSWIRVADLSRACMWTCGMLTLLESTLGCGTPRMHREQIWNSPIFIEECHKLMSLASLHS